VSTTENITVLFTDLVGSTELASSLTPDAGDEVRRQFYVDNFLFLMGTAGARLAA